MSEEKRVNDMIEEIASREAMGLDVHKIMAARRLLYIKSRGLLKKYYTWHLKKYEL